MKKQEKKDIIFEGTMKNNRVADDAIENLIKRGYTVVVRGLAVCDLESRLSILERYEAQVATKGWGRLVVTEHHNQTYNGMPNTISYIEDTGKYDILEIFKRGETPDMPELIYGKINEQSNEKIKKSVENKKFVSTIDKKYGYNSGKDAVLKYREEDYARVLPKCEERFKTIKKYMDERKNDKNNKVTKEEEKTGDENFLDLMKYYQEVKKKEQIKFKKSIDDDARE